MEVVEITYKKILRTDDDSDTIYHCFTREEDIARNKKYKILIHKETSNGYQETMIWDGNYNMKIRIRPIGKNPLFYRIPSGVGFSVYEFMMTLGIMNERTLSPANYYTIDHTSASIEDKR